MRMGLGNALRKVWPSPSSSPDPRPRSNPSSRHADSSSASRRSRHRRKQPSLGLPPSSHPAPSRRGRSQHTYLTQQEAQERAVIASYRGQLDSLAGRIAARWALFDAEPDEYNVALELRNLRSSLQKALESYYAAVGARTNANIGHILQTMEQTDLKLATLDHEIMAEVERFEHAAMDIAGRYSSAHLPSQTLHFCADADDTLIELELYRDGWGHLMDSETIARLDHATAVLREVVASCSVPMAHQASVMAAGGYPPHLPIANGFPQSSFSGVVANGHVSSPYNYGHQLAAASSLDSYSAVLRHRQQQEVNTNGNSHPSWDNGGVGWQTPFNSIPNGQPASNPPDERKDGQSSESGDEGAMQMVMSRTRTLRYMAENAMSERDDERGSVPTTPNDVSRGNFRSPGRVRGTSNGYSSQPLRRDGRNGSRSSPREAEVEQPSVAQTHQMSFASTLYNTRHERVDSISDAGVFLQRSNVRGDGRCLFRAVARCRAVARGKSVPGERAEREEADHLRERTVAELIKYRELLARFFVIEGNFTQYTKKMSHPRTYGGEPELLMLAKILHIPIAVYISKNGYRQIQVYGKQYRGDPLRILYSDGVHYDSLLSYR